MHSTRQVILETLSTLGRATVSDLEQRVGVKAITVRHHLTALQAEGLVDAEPIRRPVGRPQMAYFLTDRAYNLLPHRYQTLVERLLDQIKATHSPDMVQALIGSLADSLAQELDHQIAHLPPGERRQRLIEVLNDEGFVARWQRGGDGIKLVEYHCPYYLVGPRIDFNLFCRFDELSIPDYSTLCRYRNWLAQDNTLSELLELINRQLTEKG